MENISAGQIYFCGIFARLIIAHTHTRSSTVQPDIGYSRETVTFDTEQWQDWLLQVNGRRW